MELKKTRCSMGDYGLNVIEDDRMSMEFVVKSSHLALHETRHDMYWFPYLLKTY